MELIRDFSDERNKIFCPYCGRTTEPTNREHVPSKILLDEPYPENLPIIHPCQECNSDFSKDEEYVACLIECARVCSADIGTVEREKIRAAMKHHPKMTLQLREALEQNNMWSLPNQGKSRAANIIRKLAQGHVAYELGEPVLSEPGSIMFCPLASLSRDQLTLFETPPKFQLLAEVGSRALTRQAEAATGVVDWIMVQPGRYRYLTYFGRIVLVRLIISEFLACEVIWKHS